ncbi:ATP-binding cassette domain-containing protein [Thomasclavelia sp.]
MLKLKNVKKNYDNFNLNCSLEVLPGCVTGLIGQNGAGKSTTFKAILNLISIDSGIIEVFGKNNNKLTNHQKQDIGVVLSDSGFSEYLMIKDIIPVMESLYDNFDKARFIEQCHHFELPFNKQIKDFSTGMKVKLKVLIALSHHSKLLILDEPTAGLDVIVRDELIDMLRDYMVENEDSSILISSHISSDLEGLCDDLYMIHKGSIVMHEETDILLSDYAILKVDEKQFKELDKKYLLNYKKESFGYRCLTNQKSFYLENYPSIVIEKGSIDEVLTLMIRGEK